MSSLGVLCFFRKGFCVCFLQEILFFLGGRFFFQRFFFEVIVCFQFKWCVFISKRGFFFQNFFSKGGCFFFTGFFFCFFFQVFSKEGKNIILKRGRISKKGFLHGGFCVF